ncbi:MAG: DEAD/DEAH box helicase [Candidatus Micrarchaeia archaeon]
MNYFDFIDKYINSEGLEVRAYQRNIVESILKNGNTLVVLPTGLGKTLIGIIMIAFELDIGKKAIFLAPTKPLAEQHYNNFKKTFKLNESELLLLIGSVSKKKRVELEKDAKIIVATPQTVANELKNSNIQLDDYGIVVFDECHKAVGKYAYTYIANECNIRSITVLGLTASPGSKKEKIKSVIDALGIKNIEVRISTDPDVSAYVKQKYIHNVYVDTTETIKSMMRLIAPEAEGSLRTLNKMGFLKFKRFDRIPKGILIDAGNQISRIKDSDYRMGAFFSYVKLLNLCHAYELLTTEGIYPFLTYMKNMQNKENKSRGVRSILANKNILAAIALAEQALKRGEEHGKIIALIDIIIHYKNKSIIVFAQYRSTIKMIVEYLTNNDISCKAFVGKKEGVTQELQKNIIQEFRDRKFNVLVASSIAEEGLDIPSVDAVIFYEPIPSEIRNIQRRGRTGRFREGDIYILIARDTKDEVYIYISGQRERKMLDVLKKINLELDRDPRITGQAYLGVKHD